MCYLEIKEIVMSKAKIKVGDFIYEDGQYGYVKSIVDDDDVVLFTDCEEEEYYISPLKKCRPACEVKLLQEYMLEALIEAREKLSIIESNELKSLRRRVKFVSLGFHVGCEFVSMKDFETIKTRAKKYYDSI
jgi:hypothetical protein